MLKVVLTKWGAMISHRATYAHRPPLGAHYPSIILTIIIIIVIVVIEIIVVITHHTHINHRNHY